MARGEVEGVLQEAVRSFGLDAVRKTWASVKADVKFRKAARYLPTLLTGPLAALPVNRREAGLAALALLANA